MIAMAMMMTALASLFSDNGGNDSCDTVGNVDGNEVGGDDVNNVDGNG